MEKFSDAYFQKLANQLMFSLSEQEVKDLQRDFNTLEEQLALFDAVDTENVEEMVYPFEMETSFMREDVVSNVVTQEEALQNAAKTENGMIGVPKVVK
ncbi:MAG: Asp-tRNA(Asn)/Glu-tRNA(Gln) amidotransferase subunit GatC [Erysipelotrichaceae bacterium]